MLRRYSLDFKYEYPLAIIDRGRTRLWYPDYALPQQGVSIEYCGVNGNSEYDARVEHKKLVYSELGIPALFLVEEELKGCWPHKILDWLERVQADRLEQIRTTRRASRKYS